MGVKTWAYDPERCDGLSCCCDCYKCEHAEIGDEHIPIEVAFAMLKANIIDLQGGDGEP